MTVVGPAQNTGGQEWKNVRDPDGNSGWVASAFLVVAPASPEPVSTVAAVGSPTAVAPAAPTVVPTATAIPTATSAPVIVSFVNVVGGHPGQTASATIQSLPGAACRISYVEPRGTEIAAPGLDAKTADSSGRVSWSWPIDPSTPTGSGVVTISCNGATATTEIGIN
jgi:hypothetical protein